MSSHRNTKCIVQLINGERMEGEMVCGASGRLESVLLQPIPFVEFHPETGGTLFINRDQIAIVEPIKFVREQAAA